MCQLENTELTTELKINTVLWYFIFQLFSFYFNHVFQKMIYEVLFYLFDVILNM